MPVPAWDVDRNGERTQRMLHISLPGRAQLTPSVHCLLESQLWISRAIPNDIFGIAQDKLQGTMLGGPDAGFRVKGDDLRVGAHAEKATKVGVLQVFEGF